MKLIKLDYDQNVKVTNNTTIIDFDYIKDKKHSTNHGTNALSMMLGETLSPSPCPINDRTIPQFNNGYILN